VNLRDESLHAVEFAMHGRHDVVPVVQDRPGGHRLAQRDVQRGAAFGVVDAACQSACSSPIVSVVTRCLE
jgi:hypothetical protein